VPGLESDWLKTYNIGVVRRPWANEDENSQQFATCTFTRIHRDENNNPSVSKSNLKEAFNSIFQQFRLKDYEANFKSFDLSELWDMIPTVHSVDEGLLLEAELKSRLGV
jgi:hypothetical protein